MNLPRKNILFIITKSNWGGAQRYVYDLATSLPKDQFAVMVALGGAGELSRKLQSADIPVERLSPLQRNLSLTADLKSLYQLYSLMRTYRPDVVHLNSSKVGGLGALAARLARVPLIIFTAHGWPFAEKRSLLWRIFAWTGSWLTALLSDTVIVVSRNDLHLGRQLPFCGGKMRLIYNGINLDQPLASGEQIRAAFPAGVHITGTIGELTANKNQISLIEQVRTTPDLFVAIVGEGEDRQMLETKIAEYGLQTRVKLFGFIPASEVLRGFDTFVLPSLKEGLPYVLLEARAAGLPILANRVGGVSEILDAEDLRDFSLEQMCRETFVLYTNPNTRVRRELARRPALVARARSRFRASRTRGEGVTRLNS